MSPEQPIQNHWRRIDKQLLSADYRDEQDLK